MNYGFSGRNNDDGVDGTSGGESTFVDWECLETILIPLPLKDLAQIMTRC